MSGPLPAALLPVTAPASYVYRCLIGVRNRRFDRGVGVRRLPVPVISVGNLSTGGAGKTPFVAWTAERLLALGRRPVVAMRGYGARPGEISDEAAEYAERLPGVPVAAHPDRAAAAGGMLEDRPELDCVILDDGFQHRRLHRDLDLVVIDAAAGTLCDRLLPAGHLREPPAALARADAVIVTHAESGQDDTLARAVAAAHGRAPVAWTRHGWPRLRLIEPGGVEREVEVAWLRQRRLLTMLGIGAPERVVARLEREGASVALTMPVRDHERYDRPRLLAARTMCRGLDAMVVTAKDWVKIRPLIEPGGWPIPVVIPVLRLEVVAGEDVLTELIREAVEG